LALRIAQCGSGLTADEIWEFAGILNKEDGSIVSHQVENALFSVKLGRKSPYISDRPQSLRRLNRRESDKNRGDFIFITQKVRFRRRAETGIGLKVTVSGRTSGMYDPPDAFMIKMGDFFRRMKSSSRVGPRFPARREF
jgi:hypothetical protein